MDHQKDPYQGLGLKTLNYVYVLIWSCSQKFDVVCQDRFKNSFIYQKFVVNWKVGIVQKKPEDLFIYKPVDNFVIV